MRSAVLVAMTALLLARPWSGAAMVVPALSPLVLLSSALATRAGHLATGTAWLSPAAAAGLPVLLMVMARRRWFCRYGCPVGLLSEPFRRRRRGVVPSPARWPHIGRWIALATIAGSAVGYPLAIWLDPLAIFSGSFGLISSLTRTAGCVAVAGLAGILLSNLLWPNAWCLRVCPLGATQELLAEPLQLLRGRRACCQRHGLWGLVHFSAENRVSRGDDGRKQGPVPFGGAEMPRRSVFSWGLGAAAAALGVRLATAIQGRAAMAESSAVRPPGAAPEERFAWLCTRCGNCSRSCPEGIIHPEESPRRPTDYLVPVVRFETTYCREGCRRCTEVCPSGAIARLSLAEKRTWPMGIARVDMRWCLLAPENGERECAICQQVCPYAAVRFEFDYETYVSTPRVDPRKCTGCGACEVACPGTESASAAGTPGQGEARKAIRVGPARGAALVHAEPGRPGLRPYG